MNTKIIASLATIVVVGVAAIGGTIAYYTSSASMTGATFTSSNMALKIDSNPAPGTQDWVTTFAVPDAYYIKGVKPGDTDDQILDLKNEGDVNGNVSLKFEVPVWSVLAENLVFTVYFDKDNDDFIDAEDNVAIATGTLAQYLGNTYPLGEMTANSISSVKIVWAVPASAGNNIQGQTLSFNTIFDLEQAH